MATVSSATLALRYPHTCKEEVHLRLKPRHELTGQGPLGVPHSWSSPLLGRNLAVPPPMRARQLAGRATANADMAQEDATGVTEDGRFTITEEELAAKGLLLRGDPDGLDLEQLNVLFSRVGFPRREEVKLQKALAHTLVTFWLSNAKTGQLIAFARATGDDVFNATIWDVVVDPSYQGQGLGKVVMERVMAHLVRKGISNINLYAERNVVGFYKPLGFITDPSGIQGMAYSKRRR